MGGGRATGGEDTTVIEKGGGGMDGEKGCVVLYVENGKRGEKGGGASQCLRLFRPRSLPFWSHTGAGMCWQGEAASLRLSRLLSRSYRIPLVGQSDGWLMARPF